MLIQFLVSAFVTGFIGIVVLGHVLLTQAIFAPKDNLAASPDHKPASLRPLAKA